MKPQSLKSKHTFLGLKIFQIVLEHQGDLWKRETGIRSLKKDAKPICKR